ncbi:NADPH-dependent 7-cyano-7-deazaguanine reductase QueF [Marinospirillum sp. MEB164]|uniref:NADPH-dependent 7-cyano-7-deazaguanine reductase n=1 Tax=Marinospirillum alkalitolerans TaxID=3123374 RepID=A0ABW8PV93_9GAMM
MAHPDAADSPLGQATHYVNQYNPQLLFPLARDRGRLALGLQGDLPFSGWDIWNAYEISWLNARGKPLVRLAEFRFAADSTHIIESKSFKLYLNSFNLSHFKDESEVHACLTRDLSAASGAPVEATLMPVEAGLLPQPFQGVCLDALDIEVKHYTPAPQLLSSDPATSVEERLYSHLLKSNCPVTGQPDWASVMIHYRGPQIDPAGLLAYLISYREQGDFHEQCVEQIFIDLQRQCQPEMLSVYARYLRRGGLDINPWRTSEPGALPPAVRLLRQ